MKYSLSAGLIFIAFLCTLSLQLHPEFGIFGMSLWFYETGEYDNMILQFVLYSFFHGNWFHWLSNSVFVLIFGNMLEQMFGKKMFGVFFLFSTLFNGIFLLVFSSGNTIGMSGFALAILSYYTLFLYQKRDPEYKGGIMAIGVCILIGFAPGISLAGHLAGALSGAGFYFLTKFQFRK